MMRFPFILTLCSSLLMITACSFLQTSTSENSSTTTTPKIEETVKSATDRVTNKVQSTIDRTHSVADRAVQSASEQVQRAKPSVVADAIAFKEGLQGMSTKVSSTLNAINSGDFPTAQQEFSQLQDNWTGIGNTVQKSSTKVYQQVDSKIKAIASLLNQPNPERTKLVTELNALRKTLTDSFNQL